MARLQGQDGGISLSTLVRQAAAELRDLKAVPPIPGQEVMSFTECSIELSVTVTNEASGGLKFWVVEAGGKAVGSQAHKITLKFSALDPRATQAQGASDGKAPLPGPASGIRVD